MTIILTAAIPDAIVMAAESRCILANINPFVENKNISGLEYTVLNDNSDKIHPLGGRFALAYAGFSFNPSTGWQVETEVAELDKMARQGVPLKDLAHYLIGQVSSKLPAGQMFCFHLAGYSNDFPLQHIIRYDSGKEELERIIGYRPNSAGTGIVQFGMLLDGETRIIKKLIANENVPFGNMTIEEACQFSFLTVAVGCEYLRFFRGYEVVSAGPIDVLLITPEGVHYVKRKANIYASGGKDLE